MSDKDITYEEMENNFNRFLQQELDVIDRIAPESYIIKSNDEWNDSIYDKYDKMEV